MRTNLVFELACLSFVLSTSLTTQAQDLESILNEGAEVKTTGAAAQVVRQNPELIMLLNLLVANPTPDQSLFVRHLESGEWNKALLQFPIAFEGTPFQKSANGQALFALCKLRSGLPIAAVEALFKIEAIKDVHPELRRQWKDSATESHFVWDLAQVKWKPEFAELFSPAIQFRIEARDLYASQNIEELKSLYARLPTDSRERSRVAWQLVIAHSLNNQVEDAARVLASLSKSPAKGVSRELLDITAARLLYQRAHFSPAIKYYKKIPRTSEYWMDAQEEMAWAFVRKGEPQNALATTLSLVNPALVNQTDAEAFFVHSLSQLKVCDYSGVLKSLKDFSLTYKPRNAVLTQLTKQSEAPQVSALLADMEKSRITRQQLGKSAQTLPRMVNRDERLYDFAQAHKWLQAEASAADKIYAQSLAATGLQGQFDLLRQNSKQRAESAHSAFANRVKQLAQLELKEIHDVLRKLHIVEAEVIQQVSIADRVIQNTQTAEVSVKKGSTGAQSRDVLRFKADDEVWFDEIGHYKADVTKACQAARKGRT